MSLYSSFIVQNIWPNGRLHLFNYARGQLVPGVSSLPSPNQILAQNFHTNVPRSSDIGLPMYWAMQVDRWRASTNLRFLVDPVLEWAAETSVSLQYNGNYIQTTPLADILMAPQPLSDSRDQDRRVEALSHGKLPLAPTPLVMRENLSFRVEVERPGEALEKHLVNWLVENAIDLKRDPDGPTRTPRLIVWVWLEGVLMRAAY